jgi:hypothetical protein
MIYRNPQPEENMHVIKFYIDDTLIVREYPSTKLSEVYDLLKCLRVNDKKYTHHFIE